MLEVRAGKRAAKAVSGDVEVKSELSEEIKTILWKRVDRARIAWGNKVKDIVLPLYESEGKRVSKAISKASIKELEEVANEAIDDGKDEWEKTLTAVCSELIKTFGEDTAVDIMGEKSYSNIEVKDFVFDPTTPAIRKWIGMHCAESIKTIAETNKADVARIIQKGFDENLGNAEIAEGIMQLYADRNEYKAIRVARTETSRAAGFGNQECARQSGVIGYKMWITSRDDRVRDEHKAVDKEKQKLNEAYSTGEMYPGENSINCRCVEGYLT
jgi:SPP1 gp7 family putative phage head morphogenesis protein